MAIGIVIRIPMQAMLMIAVMQAAITSMILSKNVGCVKVEYRESFLRLCSKGMPTTKNPDAPRTRA